MSPFWPSPLPEDVFDRHSTQIANLPEELLPYLERAVFNGTCTWLQKPAHNGRGLIEGRFRYLGFDYLIEEAYTEDVQDTFFTVTKTGRVGVINDDGDEAIVETYKPAPKPALPEHWGMW